MVELSDWLFSHMVELSVGYSPLWCSSLDWIFPFMVELLIGYSYEVELSDWIFPT